MGPHVYRGEYTVKSFLYYIELMERTIRSDLHKRRDLNMTRENWADYNKASECHICHETLYKNHFLDSVGAYDSDTGEYIRLVDMKTNKCYSSTFKIGIYDEKTDDFEVFPFIGSRRQRKPKPNDLPQQDICYICSQPLVRDFIRDSVRNHCHITGEYRGAAHRACNINYFRIDPETVIIPVVFHNLKGYDVHHIMSAIADVQSDLSCILTNMEKNVFFSLGNLRFIDSCQFMQSSLDNLVKSNKIMSQPP